LIFSSLMAPHSRLLSRLSASLWCRQRNQLAFFF
jgi:hypothetical protein